MKPVLRLRFGIRAKLLLVALTLLAVPWVGLSFVQEMERFLRQGLEQSVAATAQAVGPTVLFNITGRTFHHLYKQMPEQYGILMLNIARDLSRRLRQLDAVYLARR